MPVRPSFAPPRVAVVCFLALGFAGCAKKHGEAIIVEKEYIKD
jgi:hypothetical protein